MLVTRSEQEPERSRDDPRALAAYREASRELLERARHGVRAEVVLEYPDGSSGKGLDEYISTTPLRLREIRPSYEAVGVGDTVCTKQAGEAMACDEGDFYIGIREFDESAIRRAQFSMEACAASSCRRVDIEQQTVPWEALQSLLQGQVQEEREARQILSLLIREDGLPYSFTESTWSEGRLVEALATYRFDYDVEVNPIELPIE